MNILIKKYNHLWFQFSPSPHSIKKYTSLPIGLFGDFSNRPAPLKMFLKGRKAHGERFFTCFLLHGTAMKPETRSNF